MTTAIALLAAIVAAFIQRPRSSRKGRWYSALRAATLAAVSATVCVSWSVYRRGLSTSSVALCGVLLVEVGAAVLLLGLVRFAPAATPSPRPLLNADGSIAMRIESGSLQPFRPPTWVLLVLAVGLFVLAVWSASYGGGFVRAVGIAGTVETLSPEGLAPLEHYERTAEGQCLKVREPKSSNVTTSCDEPHRSEIVEAINPGDQCRRDVRKKTRGYQVAMLRTGKIDGTRYCYIVSSNPGRLWLERVWPLLAHTL